MQIHTLKVASFRLYEQKSVELAPGMNFIQGRNAIGKTTLLEALYLLMAGRSFRTAQMQDMVKEGEEGFRVEVEFEKSGVAQFLKMAQLGTERRLTYNSTQLPTLTGLLGILQGVLMAPHDMELIKGAPHVRRHYLDLQIAQVDPLYVHHLTRYSKAIKQRNWMLRSRQLKAVDAFEEVIAQSAAYIMRERGRVVCELERLFRTSYHSISGFDEPLTLIYHASFGHAETPSAIQEKLRQHRQKEIEMGYTTSGPHRDDLKIQLHKKEARLFASEGEMRSIVAALRLAEWQRMRQVTHEPPLLLVDDFGISMDPIRLKSLGQIFSQLGQVIITSPYEQLSVSNSFNLIKLL